MILPFLPLSGTIIFFGINFLIVLIIRIYVWQAKKNYIPSIVYDAYFPSFFVISCLFLVASGTIEGICSTGAKESTCKEFCPDYYLCNLEFGDSLYQAGIDFLFFATIVSLTFFGITYLIFLLKEFYYPSALPLGKGSAAIRSHTYYKSFIRAIQEVHNQTRDYVEVNLEKERLLELEEDKYASSLAVVKWIEVTLPILGFIGTVMGMQEAMDKMAGQDIDQGKVIDGMKFAFSTTLWGLVGLLVVGATHLSIKNMLIGRLDEIRINLGYFINHIDFSKPKPEEEAQNDNKEKETGEQEVDQEDKDHAEERKFNLLLKHVKEIGAKLDQIEQKVPQENDQQQVKLINQRLEDMQDQLDLMDMQMTQTNDTLEDIMFSERDGSSVLVNVKDAIEKVILEIPAFQRIKNVLFYPILEFDDLTSELSLNIQDFLRSFAFYTDEWRFSYCWSALRPNGSSYALISVVQKTQYIFQFNFAGNVEGYKICSLKEAYKKFIPLTKNGQFIGIDHKNQPFKIEIPKYDFTKTEEIQAAIENRIHNRFTYEIIGVSQIEKYGSNFLFIYYLHQNYISVELIDLEQLEVAFKPYRNETLKCTDIYTIDEENETLYTIVAPQEGETSNYLLLMISFDIDKKKKKSFELREKINRKILLASHIVPQNIYVLGKEEILLLDSQGNLHYWRNQLSSFVQLKNDFWEPYPDKSYDIQVGSDGWIAVTMAGILRMWQIKKQLKLVAYEELIPPKASNADVKRHFSIKDSVSRTLAVSSDHKFVFGIQDNGQALPVWRFPVIQGNIK